MKIKTQNLQGAQLAWAVAQAEGVPLHPPERGQVNLYTESTCNQYDPCLNGNLFVILMNQEKISVNCDHDGVWIACSTQNYADERRFMCSGVSMQQAAMRTLVFSKLGDEVEIPKELQ